MTPRRLLRFATSFEVQDLAAKTAKNEETSVEYRVECFNPFIFVIFRGDNQVPIRILASWYDGKEASKNKLDRAIEFLSSGDLPFGEWCNRFNLQFLGAGAFTADYFPNVEKIDPREVRETKAWLSIDGVKGDWEMRRASCKTWHLDFDELHADLYTLMGIYGLTLMPAEHVSEFLFHIFGILPSNNISLDRLRTLLRDYEFEEISRDDLMKSCGITTQALSERIKKQGHPKPCRVSGKKQWFSLLAVEAWEKSRKN